MAQNFIKAFGKSPEAFSNALYALCDFESLQKRNLTIHDFISIAKKMGASVVQYRDKISPLELQKQHLQLLQQHLNIPIIINDKIELIEFAQGIHLGQEDLAAIHTNKQVAVKLVRSKIGNKLLGLSTHNEVEILQANELDLDMIGLGAYRTTLTKDVDTVLGDNLCYLAKISKHPVCAIGGLTMSDKLKNVHFNVISSALYEN